MTERFIVDDAGTLIDIETRDTFDYVSDVCELLNELHEENQSKQKLLHLSANKIENLLEENERLLEENKELEKFRYYIFKRMSQIYEDKE